MYKTVREIHLIFSLAITPFLFIYAISALIFSFHFLDNKTIDSSTETFELTKLPSDTSDLVTMLSAEYGVNGEVTKSIVAKSGEIKLVISRVGSYDEISVNPQTRVLTVNKNSQSVQRFLKALHHSSGFDSISSAEKWWGVVVILVAILLAGIVVTGVILWSYNQKERRGGLIFLGLSFMYCSIVLAVLRFG